MKSILIVGGTGFTGSNLIKKLIKTDFQIVSISKNKSSDIKGVISKKCDLSLPKNELKKFFFQLFNEYNFDFVFVLSSIFHCEKILEFCPYLNSTKLIILSSASILNRKTPGEYVRSIIEAENKIKSKSSSFVIIRPNMIFGSSLDRNISKIYRYIEKRPIVFLPGFNGGLIQPIFYKDLIRILINLVNTEKFPHKNIYNVGGIKPITSRKLISLISRELGKFVLIIPVPKLLLLFLNKLIFINRLIPLDNQQIKRVSESKSIDNSAATNELDYVPTSYRQALANLRIESMHKENL